MSISSTNRFRSIDLLRGAIMILMVIDHTRCYSGIPAGGPEPALFFTRWVTHFCAPVFAFFAGTAAYFFGQHQKSKTVLSRFLLTRGLLLIIFELTIVRLGWAFHFDYSNFIFIGILWMLGWCMILMAGLIWLKPVVIGVLGMSIILFQPVFAMVPDIVPLSVQPAFLRVWDFVYPTRWEGMEPFAILYVIVPWIGVMATGYAFGLIMQMDAIHRKRICMWIGLSAIFIFVVGGSIRVALDIPEQSNDPFIYQLLGQRKYPASTWYLLMTLGPVIALIPFAEKARGWFANFLVMTGGVPMFYYLLHLPVIHVCAQIVNYLRNGFLTERWYQHAPFASVPAEFKWSLWLLYVTIVVELVILYVISRWYARYKVAHREKKWLKYL